MKYKIYEKGHHSFFDLIMGIFPANGIILEDKYDGVVYTNSGRVALRIILDYLKLNGQIKNKNTEVLVPHWMCMGVIMSMHKICFPSLSISKNTKGIIIYHQYGFPQNMNEIMPVAEQNNWFIIEDCVNVYESFYQGRKLGTFGLASIFSLAKMFSLPQGGALVTGNSELLRFAHESGNRGNNSFINNLWLLSRIMNEYGDNSFWQKIQIMAESLSETAKKTSSMSLNIARREIKKGAMKDRQRNYHFLLNYFKDYDFFQDLERDVIPYVVPLIANDDILQKIKNNFLASGIWTDIYHFDVNRNILNPEFKRCVWIPIHQGISEVKMEKICKVIRKSF
jgi:hypothetical protein